MAMTDSTDQARRKSPGIGYGAIPLMLILPPLVYYLWICVTRFDGALFIPRSGADLHVLASCVKAPTLESILIYLGWFGFQAFLQILAPGPWVEGAVLPDGTRKQYRMNGWFSFWFTWACLGGAALLHLFSPTLLVDQFAPVLSTASLFAFALAAAMYVLGAVRPDDGARHRTGNAFYDYFMGTALNPRTGRFDWKLFCEARPGLIGWTVIDGSLLLRQIESRGSPSLPLLLVVAFQFFYVADYYFHEEAILSTWDIKHENFGWMLCFGDLVWVPFMYSLQAFYLLDHHLSLSLPAAAGITLLNFAGYYFFRATNLQKHRFRKDPASLIWGRKPEYLETARGTLLLVSGWWGVARHLNYLGDLMMGLAWCLLCGFDHPVPYFFIFYFTILLVHRERRDHAACAQRYGKDWDVYCQKVRYRILPGIY